MEYLFLAAIAALVFITKVLVWVAESNGDSFNYRGDSGNYS